MAKKIEDAIREAEEVEGRAYKTSRRHPGEPFESEWIAASDRLLDLRAAQARGETTVPDGD